MKTLVLVGGGHAHVHAIKQLAKAPITDVAVILISTNKKQYYSGMASAYLEGLYTEADFSFDLPRLCAHSGISFIEDTVTAIDPVANSLQTAAGLRVAFDILSLDTGSELAGKNIPGAQEFAQMIKPLGNLIGLKEALEAADRPLNIVITGAGAAGVEIALAIRSLATQKGQSFTITIIEAGSEIMSGYRPGVKQACQKRLADAKVTLLTRQRVTEITDKGLRLESAMVVPYDLIVWAAGTTASRFYRESGLPVDQGGYLLVEPSLQAVAYPHIFGAGDCIAFKDYDYVKKAGVYAIREAPFLWQNLCNSLAGKPLVGYRPQKSYLAIINQGDRCGLLSYGGLVLKGRLVWRLKDRIDRRFMATYQAANEDGDDD